MNVNRYILSICFCISILSCVEEIDLQSETALESNSIVVIEATITNELKHQQVKLSKVYELEESGPAPESDANVTIIGGGLEYQFQEVAPGQYESQTEFRAEANTPYKLAIVTSNGRDYSSDEASYQSATSIDSLYVVRDFNENGEEGVSIYIDATDSGSESKLYRHTYEETYKIIAPLYSPFELIINNDDFPYPPTILSGLEGIEIVEFFVLKEFRPEQEQICYNTVASNNILLVDANQFETSALSKYRVRFISRDNYILSHRYSILVKQFTQSQEAHQFYTVLNNFSGNESLFSEVQTGFLDGNVFSLNDPEEKVVGYFEVAPVDEKRVYFNYDELFPDEELPPYYIPCDAFFISPLFVSDPLTGEIQYSPVQEDIKMNKQLWDENLVGEDLNILMPYQMVLPACGDCTVLGNNSPPDFWIE